jgi:catalase
MEKMRNVAKRVGTLGAMAAVVLGVSIADGSAQQPTPADLVDALNGVFGKHPHTRAGHAKGFCVTGAFTPAPDAAALSKAPQFARAVPIIGRFSMGGGNPQAPDNVKGNVRGLAVRFDLGGEATSDLVMISAPMFFAKSPEQFVAFLRVRTPAPGADKPDPAAIEAFAKANPETTRQAAWLNGHPVPASYAGVNYFGVHAFTLTNAAGEEKLIKFKAIPEAGELGLSDEEAKAKGPDFYAGEMKERLAKGPVVFDLVAILGDKGDPTNDPTKTWDNEDGRPTQALGKITIDKIALDATCNAFSFQPANVAPGIAGPPNDPIFQARSPAYIVSLTRRNAP